MSKKILIDAVYPGETRVVIYDQNRIQDFDYENSHKKQLKGNIYLARVTRVEPSLQAAFIEYGGDKHGFLPFNEIHPSYFLANTKDSFETETSGASISEKIPAITLPEITEAEENIETKEIAVDIEESIATEAGAAEDAEDDLMVDEDYLKQNTMHQKHKIQDVIRKGQAILVQINKEERGNKGAACTSYLSLAGRYCVLMPNSERQGGISRRITNPHDRKNLRNILSTIELPEGVSIIVRTAGAGKNTHDIRRDYYYLARLWNAIREHAIKANINSFIHAESDLLKRTIRDLYSSEVSEIQIQGNEAFKTVKEFIKKLLPLHVNKVKEYRSKTPIFTKYNIEEQLVSLYNPIATLPSGGYIVINPTEALIAIDVNSGKATTERNIEETATKTNVEAAVEVARQLRLRDMSGLIVIDFIDMVEVNNRKMVEKALRDAFQNDRAKVQLSAISSFGLLELSRQRLQSSFMEANTVVCPACNGKGHIRSFDSNALLILRMIESEIYKSDCEILNVYAHPDMVIHLLNHKREQLARLEQLHNCKIILHKENAVYYDGFALEKQNVNEKNSNKNTSPKLKDDDIQAYDQEIIEAEIIQQEAQLGLGQDLAPLKINDDIVMAEVGELYPRSNRNSKFRKGTHNVGRRKISNANHSGESEKATTTPSDARRFKRPARYKHAKVNDRQSNHEKQAKPVKQSTLKSWWNRLIE